MPFLPPNQQRQSTEGKNILEIYCQNKKGVLFMTHGVEKVSYQHTVFNGNKNAHLG